MSDVPRHQERQPGIEHTMHPQPIEQKRDYRACGKLEGKKALITGGDSGIGRAVAILYAKEGADLSIVYYNEHVDAKQTKREVERYGRKCLLLSGDVGDESFCKQAVDKTLEELGGLNILVNNAGVQYPEATIENISNDQLQRTFRTNIFSMFYLTKAALPHLSNGCTIINTASITAYEGHPLLLDYSSTKGAIVAFTRSLSQALAEKNIRVNAVAPGPIWTPLVTSFSQQVIDEFGKDTPMGRAGDPAEIAPAWVFLASDESSYMTGQVLHPNGGTVVNG
jgi:NAD(P)-dependent dehydrogenase (short-subunit alcohol dehydrogenase family)